MSFSQDYLAVGGNTTSSAADWNASADLLAYGAGENIALWRPNVGEGLASLKSS